MQRSVYESNEASSNSFLRGQNLRLGLLQPRLRRWKKKEATDVVKVGTNRERDEVLEKEEEEEEEEMNAKKLRWTHKPIFAFSRAKKQRSKNKQLRVCYLH